jgi:hypothetical protein
MKEIAAAEQGTETATTIAGASTRDCLLGSDMSFGIGGSDRGRLLGSDMLIW